MRTSGTTVTVLPIGVATLAVAAGLCCGGRRCWDLFSSWNNRSVDAGQLLARMEKLWYAELFSR